jgi:hypothetical protein
LIPTPELLAFADSLLNSSRFAGGRVLRDLHWAEVDCGFAVMLVPQLSPCGTGSHAFSFSYRLDSSPFARLNFLLKT